VVEGIDGVPVGDGVGTYVEVGVGDGVDLFGSFFETRRVRLLDVAPSAIRRSAISLLLADDVCTSCAVEVWLEYAGEYVGEYVVEWVGELLWSPVGEPPGMNAVKAMKTATDKPRYRTRIGHSSPEPRASPPRGSPHPVPEAPRRRVASYGPFARSLIPIGCSKAHLTRPDVDIGGMDPDVLGWIGARRTPDRGLLP